MPSTGALHQQGNGRLQIGFDESHAAAVKHAVITIEKTIGRIKKKITPAHNRDGGKAKSGSPPSDPQDRQSLCRKATWQPC
jgi:hypothetical protein